MELEELECFMRTEEGGQIHYANQRGTLTLIVTVQGMYLRGGWANATMQEVRETPLLMTCALRDYDLLRNDES